MSTDIRHSGGSDVAEGEKLLNPSNTSNVMPDASDLEEEFYGKKSGD